MQRNLIFNSNESFLYLHIKHWSTQQSKLRKFGKIFYVISNFKG